MKTIILVILIIMLAGCQVQPDPSLVALNKELKKQSALMDGKIAFMRHRNAVLSGSNATMILVSRQFKTGQTWTIDEMFRLADSLETK